MVQLQNVSFEYPGGEFRLEIRELQVARGETVAVVGPSGSGKTTLLNLIGGIVPPKSGRVVTTGTSTADLDDRSRRALRIVNIGLVFQEFELLDYLGVLDNVLLPYRVNSALALSAEVRDRAVDLVRRVGLEDKLRRSVSRLSQGERQRVAVCRALLTRPSLLLADEPTGNLDPVNRDHVLDILFEDVRGRGATLIAVTHDSTLLDRFDRVVDLA